MTLLRASTACYRDSFLPLWELQILHCVTCYSYTPSYNLNTKTLTDLRQTDFISGRKCCEVWWSVTDSIEWRRDILIYTVALCFGNSLDQVRYSLLPSHALYCHFANYVDRFAPCGTFVSGCNRILFKPLSGAWGYYRGVNASFSDITRNNHWCHVTAVININRPAYMNGWKDPQIERERIN
jgi:hypothetical protein